MPVLLTAFAGKTNSSNLILDEISNDKKLILTNSFSACAKQLIAALEAYKPDIVIMLGQKPNSDCLTIETTAKGEENYRTTFDIEKLTKSLEANGIMFRISDSAGSYLCNHAYHAGLRYISQYSLKTETVFIHTPSMKDFVQFDSARRWLADFIS